MCWNYRLERRAKERNTKHVLCQGVLATSPAMSWTACVMNRGAMYARMNWGAMYARMLSGLRGVDVCHVARAVPRLACDIVGHVVESVRHELGHTVCTNVVGVASRQCN